jgi:hypothetical protein
MTLDIAEAVESAVDKTISSTGAQVTALLFVVSLLNTVTGSTFGKAISEQLSSMLPPGATIGSSTSAGMSGGFPLALEMPLWLAFFSALGGVALSVIGSIGAVRALEGSVSGLERSHFTRNVSWVGINLVVGGIVFGIVVFVGAILPVVPVLLLLSSVAAVSGIDPLILMPVGAVVFFPLLLFLFSALYLWNFYVIAEDQNFIEGFKSSWQATSSDADPDSGFFNRYFIGSNRFRIISTLFLTFIIMVPFSFAVTAPLNLALGQGAVLELLKIIPGAITTTFSLATLVAVYDQLG